MALTAEVGLTITYDCRAFFILGQNRGAQQILTQQLAGCHAGAIDEVGRHGKVKAVRRVETCMPCQDHNLVFAHPTGKAIDQSCTAEIAKCTSLATARVLKGATVASRETNTRETWALSESVLTTPWD